MRLIDADKLNPDRMTNKGTVAISQSQIAKAKTVEAVPLSVIEDIKAEIKDCLKEHPLWDRQIGDMCLDIINQCVKECEPEDNTRPYYANEWLDEGKVNEGDKCES